MKRSFLAPKQSLLGAALAAVVCAGWFTLTVVAPSAGEASAPGAQQSARATLAPAARS